MIKHSYANIPAYPSMVRQINRSNVLKIVPKYVWPEDPIDPPVDPKDRPLKDFDTGDDLTVTCGSGAVRLIELQRTGKQPVKAEAFLRGVRDRPSHLS